MSIRISNQPPRLVNKPWDDMVKDELQRFLRKLWEANNSAQLAIADLEENSGGSSQGSGGSLHPFLLAGC